MLLAKREYILKLFQNVMMIDNCNTIVVFIYASDKDQKIFSTEYE